MHNPALSLWQSHEAALRRYLGRQVQGADVDDLMQDIFLKMQRSLCSVKKTDSMKSWLYTLATNALMDHFRRQRPHEEISDELAEALPAVDSSLSASAELAACLRPFIDDLPDTYRLAVQLSELESLPQQVVSERLGLSLSGAKSRIQRGREKLQQLMLACCNVEMGRRGIVGFEQVVAQSPCGPRRCV